MTRSDGNLGEALDRLLARYRNPSTERMKNGIERVQDRLRAGIDRDASPSSFEFAPRYHGFRGAVVALTAAAVLVLAVGVSWYYRSGAVIDAIAVVESGKGSLSRISGDKVESAAAGERIKAGEVFRANDASAAIRLADGSRVELRSKTEFFLEHADDGMRIRLVKGSVIVTAARQGARHLYVQTKDVIVSVVGTVFLVNAEEKGSRIAVIEGEVRVQQQGATAKNLLPGEQLSTNPKMDPLPVTKEVAWSPHANVHVALLQQSTAPSTVRPAPPRLQFEVVSIRPTASGSGATGFACRGVDGIQRTNSGETGHPSFPAPQGRCVGNGVSLARLIAFAYDVPHRLGPDTPDWSRPYMNAPGERPRVPTTFRIEAIAENLATVTLEQQRQMLQTMLADRFKLQSHRETQEVPVYVLGIAKGGIKFKESSGEESLPAADFSTIPSAGGPTLRGRSTIARLIQFVNAFINPLEFVTGDLPSHVEDRTGLTGIYEYELVLPVPGGGARGANPSPQPGANDTATRSFGWRGPAMAEALERQLGLRMQLERVRGEVLVVDNVETPSEN